VFLCSLLEGRYSEGRVHGSRSAYAVSNGPAEPCRRRASHSAEHPREVTLIGESALCGDDCEWPFRFAQEFTRGTHLQVLLIFSRSSPLEVPEHTRQMYGMHPGFPRQIAHAKRFAEAIVQTVFHTREPARRRVVRRFNAGHGSEHFQNMSFDDMAL
jgi:hypothetical protein